jgi:hypothetical protein
MMNVLLRLYPRWWRERYGAELAALLDDLRADGRGRWRWTGDLLAGAVDARLHHQLGGQRSPHSAAVRLGASSGLGMSAVLAVVVVVTNVVYPIRGDGEGIAVLTAYLSIMVGLVLIGMLARRRLRWRPGPAVAGATTGLVIAVLTTGAYFAVDNLFLNTISQQPAKVEGLAASHLPSMRLYINVSLSLAGTLLATFLTASGAFLGALGGAIAHMMGAAPDREVAPRPPV